MSDNLLTSAEMTAYWRSQEPELSGDRLNHCLADEIPNAIFLEVSVRERVKMFHSRSEIQKLAAPKKVQEDLEIQEVESEFVKKPLLVDIDQIVPCRYAVIV